MNIDDIKYKNTLYAILNIKTGKFETKLTNPGHKFWEVSGFCKRALSNNKKAYYKNPRRYETLNQPHPDDLKIVEFGLTVNGFICED